MKPGQHQRRNIRQDHGLRLVTTGGTCGYIDGAAEGVALMAVGLETGRPRAGPEAARNAVALTALPPEDWRLGACASCPGMVATSVIDADKL